MCCFVDLFQAVVRRYDIDWLTLSGFLLRGKTFAANINFETFLLRRIFLNLRFYFFCLYSDNKWTRGDHITTTEIYRRVGKAVERKSIMREMQRIVDFCCMTSMRNISINNNEENVFSVGFVKMYSFIRLTINFQKVKNLAHILTHRKPMKQPLILLALFFLYKLCGFEVKS